MDRLDRWAALLVAATYGLLVVGASVRVHGAGLACPDWPLCFGQVIPPIDFGVAFEFGHRVLAGGVSLGFLALGVAVVRRQRRSPDGTAAAWLVALAAAVLALQIVLGGLTVLKLLAEWTVASHLLAGNTFCLLLLVLTFTLREGARPVAREPVTALQRVLAVALAVAVPVQLAIGGFVSSSHAGLACGTWPTCDGVAYAPLWTGPVGLQVVHRLVAYALVALALGSLAVARTGRTRRAAAAVALAVGAQATIGVANVLLALPVEVTLLHTAGAAAVVLATTWTNWESWRAPLAASVAATDAVAQVGR